MNMKPKVLFLDDEASILRSVERSFRKQNFDCVCFESAAQALAYASQNEVCLVVTDFRMPEMDGVEFLRKLVEVRPGASRFLLSGFGDEKSINEAVESGLVHKYLLKPFNGETLLKEISLVLGKS